MDAERKSDGRTFSQRYPYVMWSMVVAWFLLVGLVAYRQVEQIRAERRWRRAKGGSFDDRCPCGD